MSNLHIVDLAGFVPNNISSDLRSKLGSDDQLNFIRIGLN